MDVFQLITEVVTLVRPKTISSDFFHTRGSTRAKILPQAGTDKNRD